MFLYSWSICFGCSKEPSHWDGSFEYPQQMFWLRNKKIKFSLCILTKILIYPFGTNGICYLVGYSYVRMVHYSEWGVIGNFYSVSFRSLNVSGIFCVLRGQKLAQGRKSEWNLGDFYPNLETKIPIFKKKGKKVSHHTHKLHDDNLLLHLVSPLIFDGKSMCHSLFAFYWPKLT